MLNDYDELFAALVYSEEEWRELSRFPLVSCHLSA